MSIENWITIGIAMFSGVNAWCQFLVKERLLTDRDLAREPLLVFARSRFGVVVIGATGLVALLSVGLLVREVISPEPLTKLSCFFISLACVLAPINCLLVFSLMTSRRLAFLAKEIHDSEKRSRAHAIATNILFN